MSRQIRILIAEEDSSFTKMIEDSLRESGSLYYIDKVSAGEECFTFGLFQDELNKFLSPAIPDLWN